MAHPLTWSRGLALVWQIVEAFAVHGVAGIWGTLAVGLFHPTQGVFTAYEWKLLWSQCIGTAAIVALTFLTVLPFALLLSTYKVLRVKPEEEAKGLDSKFGNAASAYTTQKNNRMRSSFLTLDAYGVTVSQLVGALEKLRNTTVLPFNPQGSTIQRLDQVAEILSLFHVHQGQQKRGESAFNRRGNFNEQQKKTQLLGFLSHQKVEMGEAAQLFKETADRLIDQATADRNRVVLPAGMTKATNFLKRFSVITVNSPLEIFRPTNEHSDLKQTMGYVKSSANFVIFLSRTCLEQPYVLCELATAVKENKNIVLVQVDWPDRINSLFTFPRHLNEAIEEWQEVKSIEKTMQKELAASGAMDPSKDSSESDSRDGQRGFKVLSGPLAEQNTVMQQASDWIANICKCCTEGRDGERSRSPSPGFTRLREERDIWPNHDEETAQMVVPTPPKPVPRSPASLRPDTVSVALPSLPESRPLPSAPIVPKRKDGTKLGAFAAATASAVGDLETRLFHLDKHLDSAVSSIRKSTRDGIPGLETFLAELVGVSRLAHDGSGAHIENQVKQSLQEAVEGLEKRIFDNLKKDVTELVKAVMKNEAKKSDVANALSSRSPNQSPKKVPQSSSSAASHSSKGSGSGGSRSNGSARSGASSSKHRSPPSRSQTPPKSKNKTTPRSSKPSRSPIDSLHSA